MKNIENYFHYENLECDYDLSIKVKFDQRQILRAREKQRAIENKRKVNYSRNQLRVDNLKDENCLTVSSEIF